MLLSLHLLLWLGGDVPLLLSLHMHTLSPAQTLLPLELCFLLVKVQNTELGVESLSPKVEWQRNPCYSESFIILICINRP